MDEHSSKSSYRHYWVVWAALLVITVVMLLKGHSSSSPALLIPFLLAGMLVKASLISSEFMHLRFERRVLILAVSIGILATAAFLFVLLALDATRVLRLSGG